MTDQTSLPFTPATPARRWLVTLTDGSTRTISAHSFRCEAGCLVFVLPVGCAAAFAAGEWRQVEAEVPA